MENIIYIASQDSCQIHIWKMYKHSIPRLIQILNTPGHVNPIIIHPNKKNLYAGIRNNKSKIINYHIGKNGVLNEIESFLIPFYSTYLNININGTVLYSSSYKNNSLSIIQLDYSGKYLFTSQTITGLMGCHSSKIEEINKRLWIPCLQEDCIRLYDINTSGTLKNDSLLKINTKSYSGPRHMVFDHSYTHAYLINELNANIDVIKIHQSNKHIPHIIQTINIIPKNFKNNYINDYWASDIHITPDGNWIYCTDRSTNTISYFRILNNNNNKKLQFIGYQLTEIQPREFAIDNQGKYLFVVGEKSNFTSVYQINNKYGSLKELSRFPVGKRPTWITVLELEQNNNQNDVNFCQY